MTITLSGRIGRLRPATVEVKYPGAYLERPIIPTIRRTHKDWEPFPSLGVDIFIELYRMTSPTTAEYIGLRRSCPLTGCPHLERLPT